MTAPKGYYRNLITNSKIRIAFTHTPIHECSIVPSSNVIEELLKSSDPYAAYYVNGLRSGTMVTIVENYHADRYFGSGELYFKS